MAEPQSSPTDITSPTENLQQVGLPKISIQLPRYQTLIETKQPSAQGELTTAVDDLLDQLKHKFDVVSGEMFSKLDDMTRRLDDLEASLTVSAEGRESGSGSGSGRGTPK